MKKVSTRDLKAIIESELRDIKENSNLNEFDLSGGLMGLGLDALGAVRDVPILGGVTQYAVRRITQNILTSLGVTDPNSVTGRAVAGVVAEIVASGSEGVEELRSLETPEGCKGFARKVLKAGVGEVGLENIASSFLQPFGLGHFVTGGAIGGVGIEELSDKLFGTPDDTEEAPFAHIVDAISDMICATVLDIDAQPESRETLSDLTGGIISPGDGKIDRKVASRYSNMKLSDFLALDEIPDDLFSSEED